MAILLYAALSKNPKGKRKIIWAAVIIFFFFSNGFLVGKVFNYYESGYPKSQKYDVGIVLGGFSEFNKRNQSISFGFAGDRLFQAIKLYEKGEIKKILITSGSASLLDTAAKEADYTLAFLKQLGIPDSSILIENRSRNTVENAKYSLAIIDKYNPKAKILVITSAWHIPRSKLIFDKQTQSKLTYYPTNFIGKTEYDFGDYILPSALALNSWELILKEWIGLIVDRVRS
ncbi:YdcF family protein [Pedobacter mucosus]|uniref:YdcF family protein n=1 Tax=Pedobacter mucosus TaxID=2895286 RepID=UPI001EE3A5BA|nr:YdcF family protein [Pedobacter mucosus]UKT62626.1 YdcF family protein [Pedobacter mucosus]